MDRTWWRIEVEPRERAAATEFLHVLLPKLMPNGAEKTAFELSTGEFGSAELTAESAAELELRVRAGNGEWLIRLKRGGGPGGRVERGGTSWPLPTKNMPNGSTIEARPPKPSPGGARRGPGP